MGAGGMGGRVGCRVGVREGGLVVGVGVEGLGVPTGKVSGGGASMVSSALWNERWSVSESVRGVGSSVFRSDASCSSDLGSGSGSGSSVSSCSWPVDLGAPSTPGSSGSFVSSSGGLEPS